MTNEAETPKPEIDLEGASAQVGGEGEVSRAEVVVGTTPIDFGQLEQDLKDSLGDPTKERIIHSKLATLIRTQRLMIRNSSDEREKEGLLSTLGRLHELRANIWNSADASLEPVVPIDPNESVNINAEGLEKDLVGLGEDVDGLRQLGVEVRVLLSDLEESLKSSAAKPGGYAKETLLAEHNRLTALLVRTEQKISELSTFEERIQSQVLAIVEETPNLTPGELAQRIVGLLGGVVEETEKRVLSSLANQPQTSNEATNKPQSSSRSGLGKMFGRIKDSFSSSITFNSEVRAGDIVEDVSVPKLDRQKEGQISRLGDRYFQLRWRNKLAPVFEEQDLLSPKDLISLLKAMGRDEGARNLSKENADNVAILVGYLTEEVPGYLPSEGMKNKLHGLSGKVDAFKQRIDSDESLKRSLLAWLFYNRTLLFRAKLVTRSHNEVAPTNQTSTPDADSAVPDQSGDAPAEPSDVATIATQGSSPEPETAAVSAEQVKNEIINQYQEILKDFVEFGEDGQIVVKDGVTFDYAPTHQPNILSAIKMVERVIHDQTNDPEKLASFRDNLNSVVKRTYMLRLVEGLTANDQNAQKAKELISAVLGANS